MSQAQEMLQANQTETMTPYLLSIQGTLSSATLEAARTIHNQTAGLPANVVVAQALGDLSHMVYVPFGAPAPASGGAGDFLILDVWNNLDGLNQFFANPEVQQQAGQIFATRDPVVWAPADDLLSYHFPAPYGKNDRIVAVVRGRVHSRQAARAAHNAIVAAQVGAARRAGDISHQAYFRLAPPNSPEALEFFAVDVWLDAAGMGQYYSDPAFMKGIEALFAAPPATSIWTHPAGVWVEW
jgi:hypothetical protein